MLPKVIGVVLIGAAGLSARCRPGTAAPGEAAALPLNRTAAAISIGGEILLRVDPRPETAAGQIVRWSSSDPDIATVSSEGLVTGKNLGSTEIAASDPDGRRGASCAVTVNFSILFLGNSITRSRPAPELGWFGDWGMAATSRDKDYVHVLIAGLKEITPWIDFRIQDVGAWERNFYFDLSALSVADGYDPNLIVVRMGENVREPYARANDYPSRLEKMIRHFKRPSTFLVVVTGCFIPNAYKDEVQKTVALNNGYLYADIGALRKDRANSAYSDFAHEGVANHPSDLGMRNIALILKDAITGSEYFSGLTGPGGCKE